MGAVEHGGADLAAVVALPVEGRRPAQRVQHPREVLAGRRTDKALNTL